MGYPEPVPILTAEEGREFEKKLAKFKLTPEQKKFYAEGIKRFKKR